MSATTNLATRLENILGANHIVSAEEELREYAVDGVVPAAIARPASQEHVVELVRFVTADGLSLIASGSRSKLDFGMPPARYDIAVDMKSMQSIAHFDAGDLTLSVDAGMPLRVLESVLSEKQQFLPLAVPCYESSTIGGAVASGIDSVLRHQYGTVRDFLIGAEFVDGTGNLCKSGGRVVKNVTGYDLHKLLVGSLGTLGVITRLNFRTFPMPRVFGGYIACFSSADAALAFRTSIEFQDLPVANIELLDPGAATLLRTTLDKSSVSLPVESDRDIWLVGVGYEGNESVVQRITRELDKLAQGAGAREHAELDATTDAAFSGVLRESFDWLRDSAPAVALFRITLPDISAANLTILSDIAKTASLRSATFLRAGATLYFLVLAEHEQLSFIDALSNVTESVFAAVANLQGCATLLHAPQTLKQRISIWGPKRPDFRMMERIKRSFDPKNIFAPGRFVGGL
jgi:glycolate oxidase FAD binding subunit